ncbi:MAG: glycosyltransferase family 2 protein [Ilyomonas sp.]
MNKPLVSVIIPVYNEINYIESMVNSVLNQDQKNYFLELLVVDGGSTDGTREKIIQLQQKHPHIQFLNNEKRIAPSAFNKGIEYANGDYIAILGAHSNYDSNYLDTCLAELNKNNCIACSGKVEVAKDDKDLQSVLIHCMLTSKFGVSSGSYRTAKEGVGEQCPYPVFKRSVFNEVGLYNETLIRNQDNDMNYRIRKKGYKLYYTHRVNAYYYPKQKIKDLLNYAIRTGEANATSLKINPESMSARHLIPFLFCSFVIASLLTIFASLLFFTSFTQIVVVSSSAILLLHLLIGFTEAIRSLSKTKQLIILVLPFLFFFFHFCYGWGTLKGLIKS